MKEDELHVFLAYLKENFPRAYKESMIHLEGYQAFMLKHSQAWIELKRNDFSLNLPCTVNSPYDDDSFFDSPTNRKLLEELMETPCVRKEKKVLLSKLK